MPLFERLKFISIFQSNLDEFFMVRVGSLFDQTLLNEVVYDSKTGMTAEEQLSAIFRGVRGLIPRKEASYRKVLAHLKEKNVEQINSISLRRRKRIISNAILKTKSSR